jgi:hypothetical protein
VANPPLNGRLILARMARPSETAQVDIGPDEIAKSRIGKFGKMQQSSLLNDTSASFHIIICRHFTTRARGIFHCHDDESRDDDLCLCLAEIV